MALERQKLDPKFIIPIILLGDRNSSIAKDLPNILKKQKNKQKKNDAKIHILSLDFTNTKDYYNNIVSLTPKGLVPMILG
jgi:hypothetical protein